MPAMLVRSNAASHIVVQVYAYGDDKQGLTRVQGEANLRGTRQDWLAGKNVRTLTVVCAGMGKMSGAVHGSWSRKGRRFKRHQEDEAGQSGAKDSEPNSGLDERSACGDAVDVVEELKREGEDDSAILDQHQTNPPELSLSIGSAHLPKNTPEDMNFGEEWSPPYVSGHDGVARNRSQQHKDTTNNVDSGLNDKAVSKSPQMQRRNSRGRRKKQPTIAVDTPLSGPIYLAPVPAPIPAKKVYPDPDIFSRETVQNSEYVKPDSSGRKIGPGILLGDTGWVEFPSKSSHTELSSEPDSFTEIVSGPRERSISRLHSRPTGSNSTSDYMVVRQTTESERSVDMEVSPSISSADSQRVKKLLNDSTINIPEFINHHNGHISIRRPKLPSKDIPERPTSLLQSRADHLPQLFSSVDQKEEPSDGNSLENDSGDSSSGTENKLGSPLKAVTEIPALVTKELPKLVGNLRLAMVEELPQKIADVPSRTELEASELLKSQVVDSVEEARPDTVVEQVGQVAEKVTQVADSVSTVAGQVAQNLVDQVAEALPDSVVEQAVQVSESVASTAAQVSNSIVELLKFDDEDSDSDDEFEAFRTSDAPEFRGTRGLENFHIKQEDYGLLAITYDFYTYMMKKPLPEFAIGMFFVPVLMSAVFTLLYLPEFRGLALDETARNFGGIQGAELPAAGLELSWGTVFEVFMFSLSLGTGLQSELAPISPYALVVANINALVAQLVFVFLSGAVFARLSQPSQPVRCSTVALVTPPAQRRRRSGCNGTKILMVRYVLAGPQPCELVDVKVDLTYKYNAVTRTGSFFRATQSLKLMYHGVPQVRAEIVYLNHGMLVRHVIDETSPLFCRTPEMLRQEDAIFELCVVGLERSSMQSVFHVQHYCVCDDHVKWNAEFEDMILISKKNRRIMDHSKLSSWRYIEEGS